LTGSGWVHGNTDSPSIYRFGVKEVQELIPTGIIDRPSETVILTMFVIARSS
jgi:hypothetical protein